MSPHKLDLRNRQTLRVRILLWTFVPTALILVAVALVNLYAYQRVTENLVIERDRDLTRLSANLLATELAKYADPLSDQFLSIFDSGLVAFDANGRILAAEPDELWGWGTEWTKRISFQQMMGSNKPVFSNVVVDGRTGQKAILLVIPVFSHDGEPAGGVAGLFRLEAKPGNVLYQSMEKIRRGESNCAYLVDSTGRVIYHSNPAYVGQNFAGQFAVQQVLQGYVGAFRTRDFEGREIVASFAPVPDTPWGLVTEESWTDLTHSSRFYGQLLLLLLALSILVPTLIVSTGVRRITRPITDLIAAAQKVAGGNFRQKIAATTRDEVAELARQFNRMADQLQELYDDLEHKVADRTHELATLNSLAMAVSRSLALSEVLNDALDAALAIMGLEVGQAFVLSEETKRLTLVACRGVSDELARYTTRLPLEATTAGLAAKEGRPVFRNVADYPEGQLKELVTKAGLAMVISTPLLAKGKTVGAIDLGSSTVRPATPEELSLLAAIGHQIGVAVENARLYERAQQLAVVEERNRLARDLHDSVMQALYGVSMYAEAGLRQLDAGKGALTADYLREIRDTAQESLREMRLLIFELRPSVLKRQGLVSALRTRLEAVEERVGLQARFDGDSDMRLAPEIEEELYRVAQEALNNVLKHAQASQVIVHLRQDEDKTVLEISDDGAGFDPATIRVCGGLGLRGMEERVARLGGALEVHSAPGQGTTIQVEVSR